MTKMFAYGFSIWLVLLVGCWLDRWWDHPKLHCFLWPNEPGVFLLDSLQTLASLLLLAGGVSTSWGLCSSEALQLSKAGHTLRCCSRINILSFFFFLGSCIMNLKNEIHRPGWVSVMVGFIENWNRTLTLQKGTHSKFSPGNVLI